MRFPWPRRSDATVPTQFAATAGSARTSDLFTEQAVALFTDRLFGIADPDIVLRKLGRSRRDLAALEYDDEIAAALETRFSAVAGTPWRIDPYETDAHAFVWKELSGVMHAMLRAQWRAVPYGYSVSEVIYAQRERGRIGIAAIHDKPMEWFRPLRDGGLLYLSADNPEGVAVDCGAASDPGPLKFLLARNNASWTNPFGDALLSRLYWPWFFRTNGWQFWARFLERFGAPLLVGSGPGSTSDLAAILATAVQSGSIAVGPDTDVSAISPGNAGEAFASFAREVDKRIQKVVLGQTLTTDVSGGGSYAAAKVQDDVRKDRTESDLRMVTEPIQKLIDALWSLNRFPGEPPEFVLSSGEGINAERAERDLKLAQAGAVFAPEYFVRAYDFEPGEVSAREAQPAPASAAFAAPTGALTFAASGDLPRGIRAAQAAVDRLADDAVAQAGSLIDPDAIRNAIRSARDEDDLIDRLGTLASTLPAPAFRDLLERALFAAELIGYGRG